MSRSPRTSISKAVTHEMATLVENVRKFFEAEKTNNTALFRQNIDRRLSEATGLSRTSIQSIKRKGIDAFPKSAKRMKRQQHARASELSRTAIRMCYYDMKAHGLKPSIRKMYMRLSAETLEDGSIAFPWSQSTLHNVRNHLY